MATLTLTRFTSYEAIIPLQLETIKNGASTFGPLPATAKAFWLVWTRENELNALELPNAEFRLLTADELAAIPDDGKKAESTWTKLLLPYSDAQGTFAATTNAKLYLFYGSAVKAADGVRASAPIIIKRTDDGTESEIQ